MYVHIIEIYELEGAPWRRGLVDCGIVFACVREIESRRGIGW
jgi:hypothetical protein